MASKKKAAKKPAKKSASGSPLMDSLRERAAAFLGDGRILTVSLVVVVLASAGLVAAGQLKSRAATMLENTEPEIVFTWPTIGKTNKTWLPPSQQERVRKLAADAARSEPSVFSGAQLAAIGDALDATGWFSGQPQVRRMAGERIEISGDWRSAVAAVRHGRRDYPVAADGARLPIDYDLDTSGLPLILDVREAPPTQRDAAGEVVADYRTPWSGQDVGRSILLIRALRSQDFWAQVAGVKVRHPESRGGLTLITDRGGLVIWGSEPGTFKAGEVAEADRLTRLREYYQRHGRIDLDRPLIDISKPEPVEIVEPSVLDDAANAGPPGEPVP
ncbi:MAG: hypothetical protein AAGB51_02000 [Planctomycetota bacterium]